MNELRYTVIRLENIKNIKRNYILLLSLLEEFTYQTTDRCVQSHINRDEYGYYIYIQYNDVSLASALTNQIYKLCIKHNISYE